MFAENLRFFRRREGMTQEDIAKACGVCQQSVAQWERGRTYPNLPKLLILCDVLHISADELLGRLRK